MNIEQMEARRQHHNEGAVLEIYDELGELYVNSKKEKGTITVVGAESKLYKAGKHASYRRMQKRVKATGRADTPPEEVEREAVDLAVAAVIGIAGWETADGQPIPFTPESVRVLLSFDHILEQVNAGIHRHASFFGSE